ncbi:MAG: hypothetical protein A3I05_03330 [Deltaproteobacteria bacterium RIFCSPLOWO2_02_FULL_44_10]|nr:MAG: hypothetical protein A3C46_02905 [Deltaproteobacteria bacterium RIFCSPHIGHO2_02_FULL_44_16]OGQ46205.1 MAG: hypothetical protein A3I05_03330 [Deltaproteobacteria bacterium RIFCSPLOWO2_02_FULL_44_10]
MIMRRRRTKRCLTSFWHGFDARKCLALLLVRNHKIFSRFFALSKVEGLSMIGIFILLFSSCGGKKEDVVRTLQRDAKTLNIRGNELFYQGKYEEAAKFYDRARLTALSIDDRTSVAESINNLGSLYLIADEKEKARGAFEEALRFNREIKNSSGIATNLLNIASLHIDEGKPEQGLKLLEEANGDAKEPQEKAALLNQKGRALIALHQYEEASQVLNEALHLALLKKLHRTAASSYFQLGRLHETQGNLPQALEAYHEALREDKLVEYSVGIASDLFQIGKMYEKLGKKEEAFESFERAYLVSAELGARKQMKEYLQSLLALQAFAPSSARINEYQRVYSKL